MNSSISSSENTNEKRGLDGQFLLRMILAAGLVGFIFLLWSEVFLQTHVVDVSPYYRQQRAFQHIDYIPAVLIGDSHTSQDVIASTNVFNFGLAGENTQQMRTKLDYILKRHPELQTVILQASPHMFAAYRSNKKGRRDYDGLLGKVPLSYLWSDSYLRERLGWYLKKFLTRGNIDLHGELSPYGSLLSDHEMKEPTSVRDERTVRERIETHRITQPLEQSDLFQAYRHILAELRSRNIATCMIEYPASPIHRRIASTMAPEHAAIRQRFKTLAKEFGAIFQSYLTEIDDYRLFRDADHLNRYGAAVLTPRLLHDCGIKSMRRTEAVLR